MSMAVAVGSFQWPTGTSDITVSSLDSGANWPTGTAPKCLIMWCNGQDSATDVFTGTTDIRGCIGFVVSPTDRVCEGWFVDDQADTTSTERTLRTDQALVLVGAGSIEGALDLAASGFGTDDQFTLAIDNALTTTVRVQYMVLGGADLTNVTTGSWTTPSGTGNDAQTGVGFQPDCMLFLDCLETAVNQVTNGMSMSLGVATSATGADNQVMAAQTEDGQGTTDTYRYSYEDECIAALDINGAVDRRATLVSFDADGWTLNWLEAQTGVACYLALKGGQYAVGNFVLPTNQTDTSTITGVGFQAQGALFFSPCSIESTQDTGAQQMKTQLGAAVSGSDRLGLATWDRDNQSVGSPYMVMEYDCIYCDVSTTAVKNEVDLSTFNSDGFVVVKDGAETGVQLCRFLCFGDAGGQTIAAGLATEADSALAIAGSAKTKAIGLATSAESALAVTALRTRLAGLATEADSAFAIAGSLKELLAGLATEADSALAIAGSTKVLVAGLATETDSALAVTVSSVKIVVVGLATEADSAFAIAGSAKIKVAGLSTEADSALAAIANRALTAGLSTEADSALAIAGSLKVKTVGAALSTESALAVTVSGGGGVVTRAIQYLAVKLGLGWG